MAPKLLQVKIQPSLKQDIEEVAEYRGISVTAFVKMTLQETVRKEKKIIFTENGLTEDQELEILRREREALKDYRAGKLKPKSAKDLFKELDE